MLKKKDTFYYKMESEVRCDEKSKCTEKTRTADYCIIFLETERLRVPQERKHLTFAQSVSPNI